MARKNNHIEQIDKIIGGRIYSLRVAQGIARKQLAKLIEVTPQQLQKYEKGTNRISVGRLVLISKSLGEEISYFYEGLEQNKQQEIVTQHQRLCLELARNFRKIVNSDHQNAVNILIKSLLKQQVA
jgi:transcriptional regulator with XRE-family HTH domain